MCATLFQSVGRQSLTEAIRVALMVRGNRLQVKQNRRSRRGNPQPRRLMNIYFKTGICADRALRFQPQASIAKPAEAGWVVIEHASACCTYQAANSFAAACAMPHAAASVGHVCTTKHRVPSGRLCALCGTQRVPGGETVALFMPTCARALRRA